MADIDGSDTTGRANPDGSVDNCLALPDAARWRPRDASQTLTAIFAAECNQAERRLMQGLKHEKALAIDSFDSGLPFESAVRDELTRLLPRRYSVTSGLVLDRAGYTAGNCDVVIYNPLWFSMVKSSISEGGRPYIPVEGVYGIGEVKQTLSTRTLDQAMEKLVKCHRLQRPPTYAHRVVENREGCACRHGLTNPLFSFILAGAVAPNETLVELTNRFFDLSKQLKRLEVVRALCVLGEGAVLWAFNDPLENDDLRPALFVEGDLFHPIFPIFSPAEYRSAFLFLIQMLQLSLFHVVLGPEDLAAAYSLDARGIKVPRQGDVFLPPDEEWTALLSKPCHGHDH